MFNTKLIRILEFFTMLFSPFKSKVILYGSGFNKFSGHTKYLFLDKYEEENSYWVNSSCEDRAMLKQRGLRFLNKGSIKHILYALLARKYFITHNISDVFYLKPFGCTVINLWHGVAIKHIGFDSKIEQIWIEKKIKNRCKLPYEKWDFFIAQSQHHKEIIQKAMKIPEQKILIETPASIKALIKENKLQRKRHISKKLVVLYVPTYRGVNDKAIYLKGIDKIKRHFYGQEIELLVKTHPLIDVDLDVNIDNTVKIVDKNTDPFNLLISADILVSDYSSIVYDFEPLGKDIYLIHDDIEEYSNIVGGIYEISLGFKLL